MSTPYIPTIGLEVHAELKTKTKMFCGSRNAPHDAEPNTHVCPVCMGHPGTLPSINKEAVKKVLLVGVALEGTLADFSEFDRKNYFYPDIPKGYQISQYAYPLVSGGELAGVAITRVHLEEDTARSLHDKVGGSLVDFNRAGVPLMELVTEPVIQDAETAVTFARELQLLLRALDVSDANMERGEMRVEVNISMSSTSQFGTKVEVKNLNSFKTVEAAIKYEIARQVATLESGGEVVQETRGWDEAKQQTVSQRKKESSHDYRYFPDPDLPKLYISEIPDMNLSRLNEIMGEIPSKKRIKLNNLGLTSSTIEILVSNSDASDFYEKALLELEMIRNSLSDDDRKKLANYVTTDLIGYVTKDKQKSFTAANPAMFAQLISMVIDRKINSRVAKNLLAQVVFEGANPEKIAQEKNLIQQSSENDLLSVVTEIIDEHPDVVLEYKNGKEASIQFLVGQGMKKTQGSANPTVLKELLVEKIS